MLNIEVRRAGIDDVRLLQEISKQTFCETFSSSNTEENMQKYLSEGFSLEKLTAELRDPNSEFYFAVTEDRVIGYLKLNHGGSQTELRNENALEIERIYVLKEFHGKHAGQVLFNKAISIATDSNADFIWLGVWEENPRAISFYKKNGFVAFDRHIFKLGDDEQVDIMMKLDLGS